MRHNESCGVRPVVVRGDDARSDSTWTPSVQIWSVSLRFGARRRDQKETYAASVSTRPGVLRDIPARCSRTKR